VLLCFPAIPQRKTTDIRKRAERRGVVVYYVAPFYLEPPPHAGLLPGHALLSEKEITEGVRRLASAMKRNILVDTGPEKF